MVQYETLKTATEYIEVALISAKAGNGRLSIVMQDVIKASELYGITSVLNVQCCKNSVKDARILVPEIISDTHYFNAVNGFKNITKYDCICAEALSNVASVAYHDCDPRVIIVLHDVDRITYEKSKEDLVYHILENFEHVPPRTNGFLYIIATMQEPNSSCEKNKGIRYE